MAFLRAQGTGEFLSMLPLVFILFGFFLVIYYHQIVLLDQAREQSRGYALADRITLAINNVYLAGAGANFTLVPDAGPFTIRIQPGVVQINASSGRQFQSPLLTRRIPALILNATPVTISNRGDSIVFSS